MDGERQFRMRVYRRLSAAGVVEWALLVIGVSCLGYFGYHTLEARHVQRERIAAFEAVLESTPAASMTPRVRPVATAPPASPRDALPRDAGAPAVAPAAASEATRAAADVLALLEIPRLDVSTAILSGDSDEVLDVAVGHLPDTPKPWESGNSAVAAHRDGLFRPLRHIRVGDEVRIRSRQGNLVYRVRETKIVAPTDLSVLAPTDVQTLTLITCYPFNFVGNAPKRFIVHAERISANPVE